MFLFKGYIERKPADVLDPPNASIVYGPKKFWNEWPSLQTAQFHQINNILPHPTDKNQAYFFSGNSYALIHFEAGEFWY